jgi:hypothetical protein
MNSLFGKSALQAAEKVTVALAFWMKIARHFSGGMEATIASPVGTAERILLNYFWVVQRFTAAISGLS